MRKLFLTVALLVLTFSGYSQGSLIFANAAPNLDARLSTHGNWLGPDWVADLYWGTQGTPEADLVPAGFNVHFGSGETAGYFFGGSRILPITGTVTAQIRVWNINDGDSFETAATAPWPGSLGVGASNLIDLTLGSGVTPPPNLIGIESFWVGSMEPPPVVPEPSVFAFGVIATGVVLMRRPHQVKHSAV